MKFLESNDFRLSSTAFENPNVINRRTIGNEDLAVPKLCRNSSDTSVSTLIRTNDNPSLSLYEDIQEKETSEEHESDGVNSYNLAESPNKSNQDHKIFDFFSHDESKALRMKHEGDRISITLGDDLSSNNSSLNGLKKDSRQIPLKIDIDDSKYNKATSKGSSGLHSILKKTSISSMEYASDKKSSTCSDEKSVYSSLTVSSGLSSGSKVVRFASNNDLVRVKTFNNKDEPSCLSSTFLFGKKKLNSASKEFIGMNVRYCLREWYLDEKSKERNEQIEKLKQKNSAKNNGIFSPDKDYNKKPCFKSLFHNSFNSDTGDIFGKDSSSDEDDGEDANSFNYFDDDGLNLRRNSNVASSFNFTSNQNWKKSQSVAPKSFKNPASKKRNSLTNLSNFDSNLKKAEKQKQRSSSLDNFKNLVVSSPPPIQKDFTMNVVESNFDYKKNISTEYPWRYQSKTVEMKRFIMNPQSNEVVVYLSAQNLAFEKSLELKYSFNSWNSIFFTRGIFSRQINNKFDEFRCTIKLPFLNRNDFVVHLDFCCIYEVNGSIYYDNNNYNNFRMKIQIQKQNETLPLDSSLQLLKTDPKNFEDAKFEEEDLSAEKEENLERKDVSKETIITPDTKHMSPMTRKFDSSKEFYNTSPWKNIYKQESFSKIFNSDKTCDNDHLRDDGLAEPLEKPEFETNYVIQNNSETSDSVVTSDDDDFNKEFISDTNELDGDVNMQKRRYSFSFNEVQSEPQRDKSSDFVKMNPSSRKNCNEPSPYKIKNPLVTKFQNQPVVSSGDPLYSDLIKNYCFFDSKAVDVTDKTFGKYVGKEDASNISTRISDIDEQLSKSSNNTIKDFKTADTTAPMDYLLDEKNEYSYQILFPSALYHNEANKQSSKFSPNNDSSSPRIFNNIQKSDADIPLTTNHNICSDNFLNVFK